MEIITSARYDCSPNLGCEELNNFSNQKNKVCEQFIKKIPFEIKKSECSTEESREIVWECKNFEYTYTDGLKYKGNKYEKIGISAIECIQ
jgi:hypothetical protein